VPDLDPYFLKDVIGIEAEPLGIELDNVNLDQTGEPIQQRLELVFFIFIPYYISRRLHIGKLRVALILEEKADHFFSLCKKYFYHLPSDYNSLEKIILLA
jgi:hypothetical protein